MENKLYFLEEFVERYPELKSIIFDHVFDDEDIRDFFEEGKTANIEYCLVGIDNLPEFALLGGVENQDAIYVLIQYDNGHSYHDWITVGLGHEGKETKDILAAIKQIREHNDKTKID